MGTVPSPRRAQQPAHACRSATASCRGCSVLRNTLIPGVQAQLANYVSGAVTAINAAHNANTAVPPPQTLTGRNTGLDLPTIVGDFSGKTNIAIVDSSGNLQQQVAIDFTAHTMSVNGGAGHRASRRRPSSPR